MVAAAKKPGAQTFPAGYPSDMRVQLWPLCCGAAILSGFEAVAGMDDKQLDEAITTTFAELPDFQVFSGEQMRPKLTFLTLNSSQRASPKIMNAIERAGFVLVGTAAPRGSEQGFYVRDQSKSWKSAG